MEIFEMPQLIEVQQPPEPKKDEKKPENQKKDDKKPDDKKKADKPNEMEAKDEKKDVTKNVVVHKVDAAAAQGQNEGGLLDLERAIEIGDRMQRKAAHQLKEKLTPAVNAVFGGQQPKVDLPKLGQGPGVHVPTPEYIAQRKAAMDKLSASEKAALDPN